MRELRSIHLVSHLSRILTKNHDRLIRLGVWVIMALGRYQHSHPVEEHEQCPVQALTDPQTLSGYHLPGQVRPGPSPEHEQTQQQTPAQRPHVCLMPGRTFTVPDSRRSSHR